VRAFGITVTYSANTAPLRFTNSGRGLERVCERRASGVFRQDRSLWSRLRTEPRASVHACYAKRG